MEKVEYVQATKDVVDQLVNDNRRRNELYADFICENARKLLDLYHQVCEREFEKWLATRSTKES